MPETVAQAYQRLIQKARAELFANEAKALGEIERLLTQTASDLRKAIRETPKGLLQERYRRDLLNAIETTLDQFRETYQGALDSAILESVGVIEARERALLESVLANRKDLPMLENAALLTDKVTAEIGFSSLKQTVLNIAYSKTYRDGRTLLNRIQKMTDEGKSAVQDAVFKGIAEGKSVRRLGKEIEPILTQAGIRNVKNRAETIAMSEINTAHREAHRLSALNANGTLKSYIAAIGWRLSRAHPNIDICDAWAGDDSGLGAGNYLPDAVPVGHARCHCYTVSVLKDYPDQQFTQFTPKPQDVPLQQRQNYGLA